MSSRKTRRPSKVVKRAQSKNPREECLNCYEKATLISLVVELEEKNQKLNLDYNSLKNNSEEWEEHCLTQNFDKIGQHAILKQGLCLQAQMIDAQRKEIATYKADLFKLQPRVEIADTEFINKYNDFTYKVSTWVWREVSRFEVTVQPASKQLSLCVLRQNPQCKEVMEWVDERGLEALDHLLSALIHSIIARIVFKGNDKLYGLPDYMDRTFTAVEGRMNSEGRVQDAKAAARWRMDSIRAAATMPDVIEARNKQVPILAQEILRGISDLVPDFGTNEDTVPKLERDVVVPALAFEEMIHTSPLSYVLEDLPFMLPGLPVHKDSLANTVYIDSISRRLLRSASSATPNAAGEIGTALLAVEPRFYRVEGESILNLHSGLQVIKLFHPLDDKKPTKQAPLVESSQ